MSAKKKILVIDDDESVFVYLQKKIGAAYALVTTTEPEWAMELALLEKPDLILCDIDMPGLSGGDLSLRFMALEQTRQIPFAYLTSLVSPSEVRDLSGYIGGCRGMAKGTPAAEMTRQIEQLLRSTRSAPGTL